MPRTERVPVGLSRVVLAALGLLLLVVAAAWAVGVVTSLVDFLSGDCKFLYCKGHDFNAHARVYGEALLGAIGAGIAATGSWRAHQLLIGHGHLSALRRDLLLTVALLAAWSLLLHGA